MIEFVSMSFSIPFNLKYALVISFLLEKLHSYWISTLLWISETTTPNASYIEWTSIECEQTFWHFFSFHSCIQSQRNYSDKRWKRITILCNSIAYIYAVGTVLDNLLLLFSSNIIIQTRWICKKGGISALLDTHTRMHT